MPVQCSAARRRPLSRRTASSLTCCSSYWIVHFSPNSTGKLYYLPVPMMSTPTPRSATRCDCLPNIPVVYLTDQLLSRLVSPPVVSTAEQRVAFTAGHSKSQTRMPAWQRRTNRKQDNNNAAGTNAQHPESPYSRISTAAATAPHHPHIHNSLTAQHTIIRQLSCDASHPSSSPRTVERLTGHVQCEAPNHFVSAIDYGKRLVRVAFTSLIGRPLREEVRVRVRYQRLEWSHARAIAGTMQCW